MSITSMMRDAAVAEARRPARATRRRGGAAAEPVDTDNVVSQLAKFIPSEAVAVYVAILPFAVPEDVPLELQDYTTRWFLAIGVGALAVLFAVGIYRSAVLARGARFRWPPRRTITVVLAYSAWVFAIPGSPVNDFGWYTPSLGAIVGIIVTAVITVFHLWFGSPEE